MKKPNQYKDSSKYVFWGMIGIGVIMMIMMIIQTITNG